MSKVKLNKFNIFCLLIDAISAIVFYMKAKKSNNKKDKVLAATFIISFLGNIFLELESDFKPMVDEEDDEDIVE